MASQPSGPGSVMVKDALQSEFPQTTCRSAGVVLSIGTFLNSLGRGYSLRDGDRTVGVGNNISKRAGVPLLFRIELHGDVVDPGDLYPAVRA